MIPNNVQATVNDENIAGTRAIEGDFPFEKFTELAEIESFRKELFRPPYYVHKWWARRLGTVFRAALLGAALPSGANVEQLFHEPVDLDGLVVLDPFMGSGVTLGEALKLGCTAVGKDINPVAYRTVRVGLGDVTATSLQDAYNELNAKIAPFLRDLYRVCDSHGDEQDVLYYFWTKHLPCPACSEDVDLISNYIFARHATPSRHPTAQALCPCCGAINAVHYKADSIECQTCEHEYDPSGGPARRTRAECPSCSEDFSIVETAREQGHPPEHRMYAKLVLLDDGSKRYESISDHDLENYQQCEAQLREEAPPLPDLPVPPGHNTNQAKNYCYNRWDQFFNARQLLGLTTLARGIAELQDEGAKEALACLFSGVLEFNNMFASYKGEGTGAVRHMFSHHIIKPERMPLEANIWGTPKSSGAFSTLYESRLLRAVEYSRDPFELAINHQAKGGRSRKIFGINQDLNRDVQSPSADCPPKQGGLYLSCGSSTRLNVPTGSVDLVLTDPPFFDNVHYSELADFFFAWQKTYFSDVGSDLTRLSTRHEDEVQDVDPTEFGNKLAEVFKETHRVLKNEGLLVFSYHHSKSEGWTALAHAIGGAGFSVVASQPMKSEMSVSTTKSAAKSPIDIDVFLVCRKQAEDHRARLSISDAIADAAKTTRKKVARFNGVRKKLSYNDVKVIAMSELMANLFAHRTPQEIAAAIDDSADRVTHHIEEIHGAQQLAAKTAAKPRQESLFF